MKKIIATSLFLFVFIGLKAQDPFFTLFRQNNLWLNPASAGMEDKHVFSLSGRTQWQTYHTAMLTYDQPLKKIKSGIGVVAQYDDAGSSHLRIYYASLCYNYQIKLSEKMKLGIGIEGAFVRRTIDAQNLVFGNQFIGTGFSSAPSSLTVITAYNYLDFNAGLWYKWSDFYAGFSVKHITGPDIPFLLDGIPDKLYQNIIFTSGYKWRFSKYFSMIPSGSYMNQGPSNLLQINDDLCLNDTYILGGGIQLNPPADLSSGVNPYMICGGINWKNKIQLMLAHNFIGPNKTYIPSEWTAYEANIKYSF